MVSNLAQFNIRYGKQVGKHTHTRTHCTLYISTIDLIFDLFMCETSAWNTKCDLLWTDHFDFDFGIAIDMFVFTFMVRQWNSSGTYHFTCRRTDGSSRINVCAQTVWNAARKLDPFKLKLKLKLHCRLNDITATEQQLSKLYGHTFNWTIYYTQYSVSILSSWQSLFDFFDASFKIEEA